MMTNELRPLLPVSDITVVHVDGHFNIDLDGVDSIQIRSVMLLVLIFSVSKPFAALSKPGVVGLT